MDDFCAWQSESTILSSMQGDKRIFSLNKSFDLVLLFLLLTLKGKASQYQQDAMYQKSSLSVQQQLNVFQYCSTVSALL